MAKVYVNKTKILKMITFKTPEGTSSVYLKPGQSFESDQIVVFVEDGVVQKEASVKKKVVRAKDIDPAPKGDGVGE